MNLVQDLDLEPADADAAYLAVALVLMADGVVVDAGQRMLDQLGRQLDIDGTRGGRAGNDGGTPRLTAAARRWLGDTLLTAAHIDGEPSPAKRAAVQRVASALGVEVAIERGGLGRALRVLRNALDLQTPQIFPR